MDMLCSLCRRNGPAAPLDLDDRVFGTYTRLLRRIGISRREGPLGICSCCMPTYQKMRQDHRHKTLLLLLSGVLVGMAYIYLSGNALIALGAALFISSLSALSYCPPLAESDH